MQHLPLVRRRQLTARVVASRNGCNDAEQPRRTDRSKTRHRAESRPWLASIRGVPPTIQPRARHGARDVPRHARAQRRAPLVHYFDHSLTAADCDAMSDALAVGSAAARRRDRRPRRGLPAEHSASRDRRARDLEVRRRRRAVQPDAARARAREDPPQLRLPRVDLPGRSLRATSRRAALPSTAVRAHDHDVAARVSRTRQCRCRPCWPEMRRNRAPRHVGPARDRRAARGRAAAPGRAHGRRRRIHGPHVGHDGRRRKAR